MVQALFPAGFSGTWAMMYTIPYEAFKNFAQLLSTINEAQLSGVIPASWKEVYVASIPKPGKTDDGSRKLPANLPYAIALQACSGIASTVFSGRF